MPVRTSPHKVQAQQQLSAAPGALEPTRGGAPGAYGGAYLPYDRMDIYAADVPRIQVSDCQALCRRERASLERVGLTLQFAKDLACWLNESVPGRSFAA